MKTFKNILLTAITILKNKYVIVILAFLVWMTFFDKNNFISEYDTLKKLSKLKDDKQYFINEIQNNTNNLNDLMTNKKNLEKFAREKYLMKKDNEDIFVFVTESEENKPNTLQK